MFNVFLAPQARFFNRIYVTRPVKSVNYRDWTGLLIQRIDPDHFILWHPSMIAGAESTIAGAELSIGGGAEGHPKSIQIDTNAQIPYNWASSLANSVDQNCERAFQTSYSIRLSARYMKHRNMRLSVETKQGRKTSGASKICSIFCIKGIDLSAVLTYRQEKKDVIGFNFV